MKYRVSGESIVLILICLADKLSTLFFVLRGSAVEQNPIMAACLRQGPWVFVLVKLASFVPFVVAVEIYRKHNAAFARRICRTAIVLYVTTFTVLTVDLNMF